MNPNVVLPDPEVMQVNRERDAAIKKLSETTMEPSEVHPVVCFEHQWRPAPVMSGGPQPVKGLCPGCAGKQAKPEGQIVYVNGGVPTKKATPEQDALWEAQKVKLKANGWIEPGSDEERKALALQRELRREEQEDEKENEARRQFYLTSTDPHAIFTPKRRRKRTTSSEQSAWDRLGRIFVDA